MIHYDSVKGKNTQEYDPKLPRVSDHLYRIPMVGGSGSEKTNEMLNIINYQSYIGKIFLYAKDLDEAKYQSLIKKIKMLVLEIFKEFKGFSEYSSDMQDVYCSIEECIQK